MQRRTWDVASADHRSPLDFCTPSVRSKIYLQKKGREVLEDGQRRTSRMCDGRPENHRHRRQCASLAQPRTGGRDRNAHDGGTGTTRGKRAENFERGNWGTKTNWDVNISKSSAKWIL